MKELYLQDDKVDERKRTRKMERCPMIMDCKN
jgi:hypothetical protein